MVYLTILMNHHMKDPGVEIVRGQFQCKIRKKHNNY